MIESLMFSQRFTYILFVFERSARIQGEEWRIFLSRTHNNIFNLSRFVFILIAGPE